MTSKSCSIILLILIKVAVKTPEITVKTAVIRETVEGNVFKTY